MVLGQYSPLSEAHTPTPSQNSPLPHWNRVTVAPFDWTCFSSFTPILLGLFHSISFLTKDVSAFATSIITLFFPSQVTFKTFHLNV